MDAVISGSSFKGSKLIGFINKLKKYYVQANGLMLVHTCRQVRTQEVVAWVVPRVNGRLFGKLILDPIYCVTNYNFPLLHSYGCMPFSLGHFYLA